MKRLRDMDHRGAALFQRPVARSRFWRILALTLAHSGDGYLWFPGLALAGWLAPDPWKEPSRHALLVILVVAAVVTTIKYLVRRRRPQSPWGGLYRKTDPLSFPSGHAARGAALAVLAWKMLPWPWPVPVTLWAVGLAWSRVAIGVHYPLDVLAGLALGALLALLLG